ncbi:TIGR03862 family flavoprotein [Swaminathania salitolerans]|uniref:NAD(FAD)-utilizing dehydrogenase n=1 Tax=Swaminathania salitolerans TaxID=182838 RepID=A0A511BYX6_9PROT|nr:TIGR03862 family flavoprotein [Swaminathania salitolerans]GBQ12934.1 glutathione reductase [Swaminathania salitolerans LMG 21291]GEL03218.1 NAD(FAD)-utilizing dehydrogenase [Swaminathania salitolerans]
MQKETNDIAVIGAGPAGLSAAEILSEAGHAVVVYDQMPSPARKFLMAGRSGLNLTHAEPLAGFLTRYGAAKDWLAPCVTAFPPSALRRWAEALGQPCFTGSSGRVFPEAMKASPLLRAWLARLAARGVVFALRHRWIGWSEGGGPCFETPAGAYSHPGRNVVLALGGASWPRLGSDGGWTDLLPPGSVSPLQPANCGFRTALPMAFHQRFEGTILHAVTLCAEGQRARGDVTITRSGLEGAPVYRLAAALRARIAGSGSARLLVDLRPGMEAGELATRLERGRARESLSNRLRRIGLAPAARFLLHEAQAQGGGEAARAQEGGRFSSLADTIKSCPVILTAPDSLSRAISTAGGVRRAVLDDAFMLRDRPGVFVAGEMLDWEAPTGGYLLQACFATGRAAGEGMKAWLAARQDGAGASAIEGGTVSPKADLPPELG